MSRASALTFVDSPTTLAGSTDRLAVVDAGVQSREGLFAVLAAALGFPSYFGSNWDALSDFLRDLSWIRERRIVIAHTALPLLTTDLLRTYLEVLAEAASSWRPGEQHELVVAFSNDVRPAVDELLR